MSSEPIRPFETAPAWRGSGQFLRFAFVGIASNLILYLLYVLAIRLGVGSKLAMTILYALGTLQTFAFNKSWSFRDQSNPGPAFIRYGLAYASGYALNYVVLLILVDSQHWAPALVQGAAIVALAVYLFLLQKFWVFADRGRAAANSQARRSGGASARIGATAIVHATAYLALTVAALSPLLWTSVPILVDYPNHLARMAILVGETSRNYVAAWHLVPNLAMDLVVPLLAKLLPLEIAGRVFIALTMLLLVTSTVTLHRALFGKIGLWPLCSLLFLYNLALYWGFLNYLFAVAIALLAFSGWIATRRWRRGGRIAVFCPIAATLFILHLFAFAIYGLLLASYELGRAIDDRPNSAKRLIEDGGKFLQFVPALLLWLLSLSNGGSRYTAYGDLAAKLYALRAPMGFGATGIVAVLACAILLYVGIRSGALKFAPAMRLPILALVAAAVLMPNWLYGSLMADLRLPVVLPFVLIASSELTLDRRRCAALATIAVAFLGLRVWLVTQDWRDMDRHIAEFRAAALGLPEGARLLVVASPMPDSARHIPGIPSTLLTRDFPDFLHLPALAVIDRDAFMPYMFTGLSTIVPAARNAGLYVHQGAPLSPEVFVDATFPGQSPLTPLQANFLGDLPYWLDWPDKFEFVLWLDFGAPPQPLPKRLEPWAGGSYFHIYRVSPS